MSIIISDDETPESSSVVLALSPIDVPTEEVQQPAPVVCPDCGIAGHHPDEYQYVPSEESAPEDEEVSRLSEEDPSEQHDPSEESDLEPKEVEQPALPVGPALPRCPICRMPGHAQRDCHTFVCLGCDSPQGRPSPVCFGCDPFQMFDFDGVCDACDRVWATAGLFCGGCDQIRIEYYTTLPPAGPSTPPINQPERHARFDLILPPPDEESSDKTDED